MLSRARPADRRADAPVRLFGSGRAKLAVGQRKEVDNAYCGAESGYVPVTTISPSMLISHLELQTKPDRPMTQYAYPMPWED